MATLNQAISVPKASQSSNRFDLTCDNVTSNDFFQFKPVYAREFVPGSKINMTLSSFTRLAPLVKPYYGAVRMVNRAFFVPFKFVWSDWHAFITQTSGKNNRVPGKVPVVTNQVILEVLLESSFSTLVQDEVEDPYSDDSKAFDFAFFSSNLQAYRTYKFTRIGQRTYDQLLNLGYNIDLTGRTNVEYSLLPLLCLAKVYYDWYRITQYQTNDPIESINYVNGAITRDDLGQLLFYLQPVPYERDYFTSSWLNPTGPAVNSPGVTVPDISLPRASAAQRTTVTNQVTEAGGTPVVRRDDGNASVTNFTQYIDTALHKATDFVMRHKLFGARTMDVYKALFGIQLSDAILNRSVHIGKSESYINISDVMQTSQTTADSTLGDYAGKGIGSSEGHFKYETEEFGMLIVISTMLPKIMYVQGRDRALQHKTPLTYFHGDFDRLGVQAVRFDELYGGDGTRCISDTADPNAVFGWTSRYAEYKVPVDRLTGLFALNSFNKYGDNDVYHFARLIDMQDKSAFNTNVEFCTGNGSQFDRVFADQDNYSDHFISIYHFDIVAQQPMSKLYEDYEWSECDGKTQSQTIGGTQLD